ncbi:hypothetical protein BD413DRAFT_201490 [Trametes elegans]|nr:hypothetical protein BD413DRAFT_201490 [Trametes elegans]
MRLSDPGWPCTKRLCCCRLAVRVCEDGRKGALADGAATVSTHRSSARWHTSQGARGRYGLLELGGTRAGLAHTSATVHQRHITHWPTACNTHPPSIPPDFKCSSAHKQQGDGPIASGFGRSATRRLKSDHGRLGAGWSSPSIRIPPAPSIEHRALSSLASPPPATCIIIRDRAPRGLRAGSTGWRASKGSHIPCAQRTSVVAHDGPDLHSHVFHSNRPRYAYRSSEQK